MGRGNKEKGITIDDNALHIFVGVYVAVALIVPVALLTLPRRRNEGERRVMCGGGTSGRRSIVEAGADCASLSAVTSPLQGQHPHDAALWGGG